MLFYSTQTKNFMQHQTIPSEIREHIWALSSLSFVQFSKKLKADSELPSNKASRDLRNADKPEQNINANKGTAEVFNVLNNSDLILSVELIGNFMSNWL